MRLTRRVLRVLGVALVLLGAGYFYGAGQLPQLENEGQFETLVRSRVEADRMGGQVIRHGRQAEKVAFESPELLRLPKDLVAIYLSQLGCPAFLQTSREDDSRWRWRLFIGLLTEEQLELNDDGGCERLIARRLAERIGVSGEPALSIAADKIRGLLRKDQLIAYDLDSVELDQSVVGVRVAAAQLFEKKPEELSLAELAELALALPPRKSYQLIRECKEAAALRKGRDEILHRLLADRLVPVEQGRSALSESLACSLR